MRLEIITFYEICAAYLEQKGSQDEPQIKMTTTEVFVTAVSGAAWFFRQQPASGLRKHSAEMRRRAANALRKPLLSSSAKDYARRLAGDFDLALSAVPRRYLRGGQLPVRSLP